MPDKNRPPASCCSSPASAPRSSTRPTATPPRSTCPRASISAHALDGAFDNIVLFVRDKAQLLREIGPAIAATAPGGLLWIVYAKQTSNVKSDLNRDIIWHETQETGWRPVTQVALDDTWSALRFRPTADVKPRHA